MGLFVGFYFITVININEYPDKQMGLTLAGYLIRA